MSASDQLRLAARVLPVSPQGRVLLLHEQNPAAPGVLYWGSVGGAVDPGESLTEAATRELFEETGIVIVPDELVGPVLRAEQPFTWDGRDYVNDAHFFALPLEETVEVTFDNLVEAETGNMLGSAWWTPDGLAADGTAASAELIDAMRVAIDTIGGAV
ncbi:NUDIX hydrolase [Nocardioides silvaticus]|uniref:NUDIX hydrolase n=1 Tax=Nocardioides silvaticus TaxID=2201891 RepID=A0A316THN3_9ACTN|nr:NUDIX domain-containing protein [Nocardioides silvaticus]PWN02739.1 NUDIX hydrolase [Nocardioides silvaticus]